MPAIKTKTTDGFLVYKDSTTENCHVVPQHNLHNELRVFENESDTDSVLQSIMDEFYGIAETFSDHLSQGYDKVTDLDLIRMTDLVNIITTMKYSEATMPHYISNDLDHLTVILSSFATDSQVFIKDRATGEITTGTVVFSARRSENPDAYDNYGIICTADYDIEIEFVTDDDIIDVFIKS